MNSSASNSVFVSRNYLILQNQLSARKLARSILNRWGITISNDSLNSIVDYSLCRAADNFSPTYGTSFVSYLFHYLRGDLAKEVDTRVRQAKIKAIAGQITRSELKNKMNFTATSLNDEELAAGFDTFSPAEAVTPEDQLLAQEEAEVIKGECTGLDVRQRQVLECIYIEEKNVEDVADQLGCSKRLVFILKKKALNTLRSIFTGIAGVKETPSGKFICVKSRRGKEKAPDIRPYFYSRRNLPVPIIKKNKQ